MLAEYFVSITLGSNSNYICNRGDVHRRNSSTVTLWILPLNLLSPAL